MVMVVTYKHHKNFKVTVKRRVSSHSSAPSELLQRDVPTSSLPPSGQRNAPLSACQPPRQADAMARHLLGLLLCPRGSGTRKRLNNYLMNEWTNE